MELTGTEKPDFSGFTLDQWRFIAARLNTSTDKEAAHAIGLNDKTPSKWANKPLVNQAVIALQRDATMGAVRALEDASLQAAMVVVALLTSEDEAVRLRAAQDILDRANGKATQRQELTGAGGGELRIRFIDYGLGDVDDGTD